MKAEMPRWCVAARCIAMCRQSAQMTLLRLADADDWHLERVVSLLFRIAAANVTSCTAKALCADLVPAAFLSVLVSPVPPFSRKQKEQPGMKVGAKFTESTMTRTFEKGVKPLYEGEPYRLSIAVRDTTISLRTAPEITPHRGTINELTQLATLPCQDRAAAREEETKKKASEKPFKPASGPHHTCGEGYHCHVPT